MPFPTVKLEIISERKKREIAYFLKKTQDFIIDWNNLLSKDHQKIGDAYWEIKIFDDRPVKAVEFRLNAIKQCNDAMEEVGKQLLEKIYYMIEDGLIERNSIEEKKLTEDAKKQALLARKKRYWKLFLDTNSEYFLRVKILKNKLKTAQ